MQSCNLYPWTTSAAFSSLSPDFITVANWLLVTGDKGHERTRSARGKQLLLNPADHSIKYFWSIMPALWQSLKKEPSVQSQGGWITSADGCPGDCRLGETRVRGSLSLHQAAQALPSSCDMVFSGHTTPLFNPPGNTDQSVLSQMERRQEYSMGNNISWGIQLG